jgi:PKD repeat protein
MKTTLRFVCILLCFFLQGQLLANTVIVKGYVKDSANNAIANRTVKIYSTDSTANGCALSHSVLTNANGYYIDTLKCNGDIRKLLLIVESCNSKITRDPAVGTTNIVEVNFVICVAPPVPTPVSCKAAFSYTATNTGIKFNGNGSSVVSGDSIISRTWKFGDSTAALTGNNVDPTHTYTKPGSYNVCLVIKTKKGCESSYCQTVVFTPASNDCKVEAVISFEKITARKFRFNSAKSSTLSGDSIVQRIWKFSDGTSLDGNQINPLKEFKDTGVYTICIRLRTVKGCEKEYCINLAVRDSVPGTIPAPVNCKSQFTFTIQGNTVKFNSANSIVPAGDSIIARNWIFGDTSATLTGNRVDPSHVYAKAGKYTACLSIKTKKGCESKICIDFTIRDSVTTIPANCKATFTYTFKDSTVYFNSAASVGSSPDDSIISRTWYYTANNTSISLGGNVIAPSYKYATPGTYTVYLYIKTKKGCENKFIGTVTIPAPAPPAGCKAHFTYTYKDSTVFFNSAESVGTSPDDSIISRTWMYADNGISASLSGNIVAPSYKYAKPGTYTVYLYIKTKKGCENKFTGTVTIPAPPVLTNCKALFTYTMQAGTVKFNSAASKGTTEKDSIISRVWLFGDSTVPMQGNTIDPLHNYAKAGKYTVILYIKTKSGCESKFAETVTIGTANCKVEVDFGAERISLKKVQFNSSMSKALYGDSIIQRNWKFGDNTILSGNESKPVKEFPVAGIYNTCLQVKTLNGCEAQVCKPVTVQDTITTPQTNVNYVKIITINPNPVITRMFTTIFSRNTNVEVEISIYDIYGARKLTIKKLLAQGNNIIEINTEFLYRGPYFLKVSSKNSMDTKTFYKL